MSKYQTSSSIALLTALLLFQACGGSDPAGPAVVPVATVVVSPSTAQLAPDQTVQLSAVPKDAEGATLGGRSISWTTSSSATATVSNTGMVTGKSAGPVTITATSEGKSGSAQITVEVPVASVDVTAPFTTLVPQQTMQLTATSKDAGGGPLGPRPTTWTSSLEGVATVNNEGLLTAHGTGTTLISATIAGLSGSVSLTVVDGAVVGPTGGTVTAGSGNVTVTIPPGAIPTSTPITVTPNSAPPGPQPDDMQLVGTSFILGPAGATFAQPITVKIKIVPAELPIWSMSGDLVVARNVGGNWGALTDIVYNPADSTVSGKIQSFAATPQRALGAFDIAGEGENGTEISVGALEPEVTLTPGSGSVNTQRRYVQFNASIAPRGTGVPIPTNIPPNTPLWKFRWRTTGQNGVIVNEPSAWTNSANNEYLATVAVLAELSGPIDQVFVDVLLNPEAENNPSQQRIVTRQAAVDADLQVTYEIAPDEKTIGPGASQNFQLVVRDKAGNILELQQGSRTHWQTSGNFGNIGSPTTQQETVTYNSNNTFQFPPPRVDDIEVTVEGVTIITHRQPVWDLSQFPPRMITEITSEEVKQLKGEAKAFVTVKVDYNVTLEPADNEIIVGSNKKLTVVLDPPYNGPGLMYRYTYSSSQGQLNISSGERIAGKEVTYTTKPFATGGTDQVQVEVVSVVGGTELETLGTATANVEVSPWRNGTVGPAQRINEFGNWFTSAQIRIPKVEGATQYEVKAETPEGLYTKSFSGATSTNVYSLNEVLDAGSAWVINIEAGFNTVEVAADARWNLYFNKYKNTEVKFKATQ